MSYAGDLTPEQAWQKVSDGATLVDVRTEAEWQLIGVPDTSTIDAEPRFVQWNLAGGIWNSEFLQQLKDAVPADREIIFLCRSGARSISAAEAATEAGFTSFNVLEGFEGVPDAYGDRVVNGWKNRKLPWKKGA